MNGTASREFPPARDRMIRKTGKRTVCVQRNGKAFGYIALTRCDTCSRGSDGRFRIPRVNECRAFAPASRQTSVHPQDVTREQREKRRSGSRPLFSRVYIFAIFEYIFSRKTNDLFAVSKFSARIRSHLSPRDQVTMRRPSGL